MNNTSKQRLRQASSHSQSQRTSSPAKQSLTFFERFFATDLRRIFTEATFLTSTLLGSLTLIIPFVLFFTNAETDGVSGGFVNVQSTVFPFVAPFLAALPFAGMYKTEVESKYSELLKLRRGGRDYAFTRFITVGISGGLALLLPEILLLIISLITIYTDCINDIHRIITVMALAFPFGFAFAVTAQSVTTFTRSKALALITPEVLYLLFTYSFPYLELDEYYPPLLVSPFIYSAPNFTHIFAFFAILILFSLIVTAIEKIRSN
jgi:ABC-type transport system involved in multi-copper enzyme maturation permease subunit